MLSREFKIAKGVTGRKSWGPTGVSFFNQMESKTKGIVWKFNGLFFSGLLKSWSFKTNVTW